MKRQIAILAISVGSIFAVAVPASSAAPAAPVRSSATAGCLWVLTVQVCLPNVFV